MEIATIVMIYAQVGRAWPLLNDDRKLSLRMPDVSETVYPRGGGISTE